MPGPELEEHDESWGPKSHAARNGTPRTLADEAFLLLRDDIVCGRFAAREKLQPDTLKKRYSLGVSPLREALGRLASDGLVTAEGQRGFFLAPLSLGELVDVTDLRLKFSVLALERSIQYGDDRWETEIVGTYYRLGKLVDDAGKKHAVNVGEWEQRNRAFHRALEGACRSPWLLHFCERLYDHSERYRRQFLTYTKINRHIYVEHRQIMEAALARDATTACTILSRHIKNAADEVQDLMRKALSQMNGSGRATSHRRALRA